MSETESAAATGQPDNTPAAWEQSVLEKVLMASVEEQRQARRWGMFYKLVLLAYLVFSLLHPDH